MLTANENFYEKIDSFSEFIGITNSANFCEVPNDWVIVITDIAGSTEAISKGKYKDVNTIGAAAITTVQNILSDKLFPFVFGGDGATMALSAADIEKAMPALLGLKRLSKNKFGLELRIGAVPMSILRSEGYTVEVAKMKISSAPIIAVFRGDGIWAAESKIKNMPQLFQLQEPAAPEVELAGLSCRWQAIPNKNGHVLSILVKAQNIKSSVIYEKTLHGLEQIINNRWDEVNPINIRQMQYKSFFRLLREEARYHENILSKNFFYRIFSIIISILIFKFGMKPNFFDPVIYKKNLPAHSDYRKFDDALRMVIDCSTAQLEKIRRLLEQMHKAGEIYYGLHESETALMTCYTRSLKEGEHIHFIDGGDGGYAMASRQMKMQMNLAQ